MKTKYSDHTAELVLRYRLDSFAPFAPGPCYVFEVMDTCRRPLYATGSFLICQDLHPGGFADSTGPFVVVLNRDIKWRRRAKRARALLAMGVWLEDPHSAPFGRYVLAIVGRYVPEGNQISSGQ